MEKLAPKIKELNCCIIIPTYNNIGTLPAIVKELEPLHNYMLVINDGSTDGTKEFLEKQKSVQKIHFKENKGKGPALLKGFRKAIELGYTYAITIDSDGQHKVTDIPLFLEEIEENPGTLLIGNRNLDQENVPGKNSFANKFSNFWFNLETGKKLTDTQSGFRLYPLEKINKMKFFTGRYEFEYEILVRLCWRHVEVISVPVDVIYHPKEKRVSHFKPFWDFTRISVLNTVLVLIGLLWARPMDLYYRLKTNGLKEIKLSKEKNYKLALAAAFGSFMGIIPIWGYQMIAAVALAHVLKLNKAIVLISANISIPPVIPLIIYASFKTGEIFVKNPVRMSFDFSLSLDSIGIAFYQYIIGSIVFALAFGVITFGVCYFILLLSRKEETVDV